MARELTFIYIVEPPEYDILACYLLASIRTHFPDTVRAIGYCPEHRMTELHPSVFRAHEIMGAEIRPMRTKGMWDDDYPHGNKILAALAPREASGFTAFVDSDVLFMRDNTPDAIARPDAVSCSAAASLIWADDEIWSDIYGAFDMPVPEDRIHLMRRSSEPRVPYYSSGFVVFPETAGPQGRFPDIWYDTARRIDRIETLDNRRPYLDQMSLPVAIRRSGLDWNELPEEQHFILGGKLRGQPLPEDRDIYAVHYRHTGVLRETGLNKVARAKLAAQTGQKYVRRLTEDEG